MSERLSACAGGVLSHHPTGSVGTASGPDALQNLPEPATSLDAMLRLAVAWMHEALFFLLAIREISMHKGHCHRPFAYS